MNLNKRKDGTYLQKINAPEGTRYAVLFTPAEGDLHFDTNDKESYLFGQVAGRMHNSMDKIKVSYDRFHLDFSHLIDEPLDYISPFLQSGRKKDLDYLKRIGEELKNRIKVLPRTKPEYGICHGDLHTWNLHFDKSGNLTLFDFDCFGYGWRAYDIAVFRWSMKFITKNKSKQTRRWNAFLKGYCEERELREQELRAVEVFVAIRQFWHLGLHTHGSKDIGRIWINDEYFDGGIGFIKDWIRDNNIL